MIKVRGVDAIKKINLTSIITPLSNPDQETSMSPYLCTCENERVVVKFAENIQGPRGLINEYIAFEIGRILKLPMPESYFVKVPTDSNLSITTHGEERLLEKRIAFGSKYLEKATAIYSERFIATCSNKSDMLLIILFDHLIHNVDRNTNLANTLFQSNTKLIYIIDHERIFGAGNIWDKHTCHRGENDKFRVESFQGNTLYGMINRNVNLMAQIPLAVSRIKSVGKMDLKNIIDHIPKDWDCNEEDRNALLSYLTTRFSRVDELVGILKNIHDLKPM
jgi:hypothetical protein